MNLVNLLGNLFGFRKRSSKLNEYNHRLKYCQAKYGTKEGLKQYNQIYSDNRIKNKFPERKKNPLIYVPNPKHDVNQRREDYQKWKEEKFGKYSDLDEIKKINEERVNRKYSDIEKFVVLDKDVKNSKLKQCYEQVRRLENQISFNIFRSEEEYAYFDLAQEWREEIAGLKNSSNRDLLDGPIEYSIWGRESNPKKAKIVRDYFESRLRR